MRVPLAPSAVLTQYQRIGGGFKESEEEELEEEEPEEELEKRRNGRTMNRRIREQ
jgi:hypothetical protein